MRRWGILVSAFYLLVLVFLLAPTVHFLAEDPVDADFGEAFSTTMDHLFTWYDIKYDIGWFTWSWIIVLATAQALLVFVSVDTSHKRFRPQRRIQLSVTAIVLAVGILCAALVWSVVMAIWGDDALININWILLTPLAFWVLWGTIFYLHRKAVSSRLDRAVRWLLGGSVLELLIAVPSHVIVRQREECSAPGLTAFGIATGIAVMLMAFGPSVFFLYQKRLRGYRKTPDKQDA